MPCKIRKKTAPNKLLGEKRKKNVKGQDKPGGAKKRTFLIILKRYQVLYKIS